MRKNYLAWDIFTQYLSQPGKNLIEGKQELHASTAATPAVLLDVTSWSVTNDRLLLFYKRLE